MIRPRWRKVFHDLWDNKVRSFLVIASIFIGIYSVGVAIALYQVVGDDMNSTWESINPSTLAYSASASSCAYRNLA